MHPKHTEEMLGCGAWWCLVWRPKHSHQYRRATSSFVCVRSSEKRPKHSPHVRWYTTVLFTYTHSWFGCSFSFALYKSEKRDVKTTPSGHPNIELRHFQLAGMNVECRHCVKRIWTFWSERGQNDGDKQRGGTRKRQRESDCSPTLSCHSRQSPLWLNRV